MKGKIKSLILFFLCSIFLVGTLIPIPPRDRLTSEGVSIKSIAVVEITGNGDFSGFPGNGTAINPYKIENLTIEGNGTLSYGILIMNTDAYFTIRNCNITEFGSCVYLINATHGLIEHNNISKGIGIRLDHAHNNSIIANTLTNGNGIYLDISHDNNISFNTITANAVYGLFVVLSNENRILNNNISNQQYGISMELSNYNLIQGNIFNCTQVAWQEVSCVGNIFLNNTIFCSEMIPSYGVFLVIFSVVLLIGWKKPPKFDVTQTN